MATGTDDSTQPAVPAEGAVDTQAGAIAAETKVADEAQRRVPEADTKSNELSPEEKIEQAKRDSRRSAVRVRVTYLAAGFLFLITYQAQPGRGHDGRSSSEGR